MGTKKIYIIRHGQTDFNLKGIVQGSGVDSSLNAKGRAQAKAFYETYQKIRFDKIYTSGLKRTQESVQHFIDQGIAHEKLMGLNEISWGTKEGQPITPEEDAYYHWMLQQWREGNTHHRIEGGESPEEVSDRQGEAWDYIMGQSDETTILVCMHGRALRILLCRLLNYPLREMDVFEHQNLCLYQIDFTGSLFVIKKHNDINHLSNLRIEVENSAFMTTS